MLFKHIQLNKLDGELILEVFFSSSSSSFKSENIRSAVSNPSLFTGETPDDLHSGCLEKCGSRKHQIQIFSVLSKSLEPGNKSDILFHFVFSLQVPSTVF